MNEQDQIIDFGVGDDLALLHIEAESNFDDGEYEGALMRYLEVFNGSRGRTDWQEKRLTIILADLAALADVYEPAMQCLVEMRDQKEALITSGQDLTCINEWAALNGQIEPERTLNVYFKLKAEGSKHGAALSLIRQTAASQIVGRRLYDELDRETLAFMQKKLLLHESKLLSDKESDYSSEDEQEEVIEATIEALLKVALELFEAAAALKEGDIGREVMTKYLAYGQPNSHSQLIAAAKKAKNSVWVEGLEQLAREGKS
ncbi:MAG: hypothetical protein WCT03_05045 [Candidatus Obscuribacterales bacterium]